MIGKWPCGQLTRIGQATYCCTGGTEGHIGIFIPCCTEDEIVAHSDPDISHPTARDQANVTFDYMIDGLPRFQSSSNPAYWTDEAEIYCYPILGVDAAAIHAACVEAAQIKPYNNACYRINGLCGGCWPCHTWPSNTDEFGQSTCVALTMRIIARAKSQSVTPFTSDRATRAALNIPSWSCAKPWGAGALTGFRPRGALEAMQASRVVGRPLQGFDRAAALCKGGTPLPDLRYMKRA